MMMSFDNRSRSIQMRRYNGSDVLVFLFFIYFLLSNIWPFYIDVRVQEHIGINPQRLLLALLGSLLLLALAMERRIRVELFSMWAEGRMVLLPLLAFFVMRGLAAVSSGKSSSVFYVIYEYTANLLVFVGTILAFRRKSQVDFFLKTFLLSFLLLLLFCVIESFMGKNLWAQLASHDSQAAIGAAEPEYRLGQYRIQGVFEQPLTLVQYILIVMPLFQIVLTVYRNVPAYLLFLSLSLSALINTLSRSSLVVVFFDMMYAIYQKFRTVRRRLFGINKIAMLVILICVVVIMILVGAMLKDALVEMFKSPLRLAQLYFGFQAILHQPMLGYGPGGHMGEIVYEASHGKSGPFRIFASNAGTLDNRYLSVALESGVPSLIFFVWFLLALLFITQRRVDKADKTFYYKYYKSFRVAMINGMLVMMILSIYTALPLFFFVAGMVYNFGYNKITFVDPLTKELDL
jgi:O-antigen ligase